MSNILWFTAGSVASDLAILAILIASPALRERVAFRLLAPSKADFERQSSLKSFMANFGIKTETTEL